jgi:hypothetical protein
VHPDDVAAYVAGQVELLKEHTAAREDLRISDISLEDRVQLFVAFSKLERASVTELTPASVLAPGNVPVNIRFTGIDLRRPPTTRDLVAHFDCTDYDGQPPTLELRTAAREPLPFSQWPKELAGGGIVANHPKYKRPFICRRGLREFHTHPEHEDQPWDRFRESLTLPQLVIEILEDLQRKWVL